MWLRIVVFRVEPFSAAFKMGLLLGIWPSRLFERPNLSTAALALRENFWLSISIATSAFWPSFNWPAMLLTKTENLLVPISHQKLMPTSSVSGTPKTRKDSLSEAFSVHSRSCAKLVEAVASRAKKTNIRRKGYGSNSQFQATLHQQFVTGNLKRVKFMLLIFMNEIM